MKYILDPKAFVFGKPFEPSRNVIVADGWIRRSFIDARPCDGADFERLDNEVTVARF